MRTILGTACLCLMLILTAPAGAEDLLSHEAFADAVIEELRVQAPDYKVRKADTLHLEVESPEGQEFQLFLDNAYQNYRASPESRADIIATHIAAMLESQQVTVDYVDLSRIVPVIKDVNFIPEMREAMQNREGGGDEWETPAHEPFNADLVILFAEDTDLNIRYLTEERLKEIGFPTTDRRARAIGNLKALLPSIEAQGSDGTYMLTAGGNYEASLVLFDEIWQSGQLPVQGELVVALPARDILLVTGSEDRAGLEAVGRMITDIMNNGSYHLTDQLFVYRDGRFVPYGG